MELESPENSTSSSLEQSKLSTIMPHFCQPRRTEKRPRTTDAEEQVSYLALLTGAESPQGQNVGLSTPTFTLFANSDNIDAQQPYWKTPTGLPTMPTPIRLTTTQSNRNVTNLNSCINLEGSTLKRKTASKDEITPNPNIWNSSVAADNYGYLVYDERYQALGLPVDPHLRMFNAIFGKGNAGFS